MAHLRCWRRLAGTHHGQRPAAAPVAPHCLCHALVGARVRLSYWLAAGRPGSTRRVDCGTGACCAYVLFGCEGLDLTRCHLPLPTLQVGGPALVIGAVMVTIGQHRSRSDSTNTATAPVIATVAVLPNSAHGKQQDIELPAVEAVAAEQ